jgi:HD-like signal output (HDOD) protein
LGQEVARVREVQVDELLHAMSHLGALPLSLSRLAAVTGAPEFDFSEVVDVVGHDMVLTAGVLRAANSAASASKSRIENVHAAVVRLGAARTLAAAMLAVVGGRFQDAHQAYHLDRGELWRHSCAASTAADLIRNLASVPLPASLGTTALLHDIGKLVLDAVLTDRSETFDLGDGRGAELCEAERNVFGIDHAEAGATVAAFWELPPAIVEGIRRHHDPRNDPVAVAVSLADTIAHAVVDGRIDDELHVMRLARVVGVHADQLYVIVESTAEQLAELVEQYEADSEQ